MRVFWYEVSGSSYSGCRSVEEVWLKQFTLWILLQDLQVERSLTPEKRGMLEPACARSLHLIAQLSETKKWAKLLPSKSTIKGESMFSFTVEVSIYAYVQMWSHIQIIIKTQLSLQLWTACVDSLSSVKEGMSQIRHVSSDCDFILSASYWVFGVRKRESKGTPMGQYSHKILWGRQEKYVFYRPWSNVEKDLIIVDTLNQCTYIL